MVVGTKEYLRATICLSSRFCGIRAIFHRAHSSKWGSLDLKLGIMMLLVVESMLPKRYVLPHNVHMPVQQRFTLHQPGYVVSGGLSRIRMLGYAPLQVIMHVCKPKVAIATGNLRRRLIFIY